MKRKDNAPLHKVKQLIKTDCLSSANVFINSKDWILVEVYSHYGKPFYIVGRVQNKSKKSKSAQLCEKTS